MESDRAKITFLSVLAAKFLTSTGIRAGFKDNGNIKNQFNWRKDTS
jgi:hypothetical protein